MTGDWKRDTPMGRLGDPKELRGPVVFMASDASTFMTGHDLVSCSVVGITLSWGQLQARGANVCLGCGWRVYGLVDFLRAYELLPVGIGIRIGGYKLLKSVSLGV